MNLLVLGKSSHDYSPDYRGTDRPSPCYQEHLGADHPLNQCFLRYVNSVHGNYRFVHDLDLARSLVRLYGGLTPPHHFEIVEAVLGTGVPQLGGECIGYDISLCCGQSILPWAFRQTALNGGSVRVSSGNPVHDALVSLWVELFRPSLNRNGLFADRTTAEWCHRMAEAIIRRIGIDAFDMPEGELEIVGLFTIPDAQESVAFPAEEM